MRGSAGRHGEEGQGACWAAAAQVGPAAPTSVSAAENAEHKQRQATKRGRQLVRRQQAALGARGTARRVGAPQTRPSGPMCVAGSAGRASGCLTKLQETSAQPCSPASRRCPPIAAFCVCRARGRCCSERLENAAVRLAMLAAACCPAPICVSYKLAGCRRAAERWRGRLGGAG